MIINELQADLEQLAEKAKAAARELALCKTAIKNQALNAMADALIANQAAILEENLLEYNEAKARGVKAGYLDRLLLTESRILGMAEGLRNAARLSDPLGEVVYSSVRPNGLEIRSVRVPLGVVGIIYEARPNVTSDAIGLCLKSGNSVILKGGSDCLKTNRIIASVLEKAATLAGIPAGAICFIDSKERQAVRVLLGLKGLVDVIIPRGGKGLIQTVVENSKVPVIETGAGVCHTYIDEDADLEKALSISLNAKLSRPSVCNAMETLLVHEKVAAEFLPKLYAKLTEKNCSVRGDSKVKAILPEVELATLDDWSTEYNDLILAIKIVASLNEAIDHINTYNTQHSEAIITENIQHAHYFQQKVEAAAVYINASTRFSDGEEFGFGAEIGISTQKLHARGPMGLEALTTTKYLIYGEGQIR